MQTGDSTGTIDCDLQAQWATMAAIAPYLDRGWRDYLRLDSSGSTTDPAVRIGLPASVYGDPTSQLLRGPTEELRSSAIGFLEANGIGRAILNAGAAGAISGISSPALAGALARATNDWLLDRWTDDRRLSASIVVAAHDGAAAAAEIRRLAGDPRVVQVVLAHPPTYVGNRHLHALFEAAAEAGLPVSLQAAGTFTGANRGLNPVGFPTSAFEADASWIAAAQPQLVSLVAEGAFEKFPQLRIVLAGFGVAWLPSLLWRLDEEYRSGRTKPPRWIQRLPSEYVREHVRVTTARIELPPEPLRLWELLATADVGELLLYASGSDGRAARLEPRVFADVPEGVRRRILSENAAELYRFA
jgi:predicted TIM-barrel fold metal-dependent hydrolase